MVQRIKETVTVKHGGLIEIRRPEIPEGTSAEVVVTLGKADAPNSEPLTSYIGSCRGTYGSTPDDADRYLRELRDEWDH